MLPGAGATIAAFLSYGMERSLAPKDKQKEFAKAVFVVLLLLESATMQLQVVHSFHY
ncbi:hypothetical protein O9992_00390 [Vibrio lentus]|nr:hypothetical protein [Vibrio lentus]